MIDEKQVRIPMVCRRISDRDAHCTLDRTELGPVESDRERIAKDAVNEECEKGETMHIETVLLDLEILEVLEAKFGTPGKEDTMSQNRL